MATEHDYFEDISKSDLMRVVVALATEVYALQDRLQGITDILRAGGTDLSALEAPREPAVYDPQARAGRDAFVARVFGALNAERRG